MDALFIQTGGTIDKEYPSGKDNHGYSFEVGSPAYERILKRAGIDNFQSKTLLQKDSLDLTDKDRQKILEACQSTDTKRIIITHGTDTIEETAKKLKGIDDKVIVLVGAMSPEKFNDSDADFNLGVAVGAIGSLTSGVYIARRGEVLSS